MLKMVGSNWILTLLSVVVTFLLLPFNIKTLGHEAYGVWLLVISVTGYLGLLVLGAPMASVRYIAQYAAEGQKEKLNEAVGTFLGLYVALGAAALGIGLVLYVVFVSVWTIPAAFSDEVRITFAIVVTHIAFGFLQQLPYGIMSAYRDFVLRNAIIGSGVILRLLLTLVVLSQRPVVSSLAYVLMAVLGFELVVAWMMVGRRYPMLRLSFAHFEWRMLKRILSFSLYVLILQAGTRIAFETDSLVIGGLLRLEDIPFYTVACSMAMYLTQFVIGIAAVVMPTATKLQSEGSADELRKMFLRWSKIAYSLALAPGLFLIVLGPRFLAWWIEPSFENVAGPVLRVLMISFLAFLPLRGVALPILMGLGRAGKPTIAFLIVSVINLGLSIALARPFGLVGVAVGTAIPNVLFACVLLVITCREVQLPIRQYVHYVFSKATIGAIPVVCYLFWVLDNAQTASFLGLFFAGCVMLLVFLATWAVFVYRGDSLVNLRSFFPSIRS